MAPVLNLDEVRAKREAREPLEVTFKGVTFTITSAIPFKVFKQINELSNEDGIVAMDDLLGRLFRDRKDEFLDLDPELDDVVEVIESVVSGYNQSLEEKAEEDK